MKICFNCKAEIADDCERCPQCGLECVSDEGTADTLDIWIAGDDSAPEDPHATIDVHQATSDPHATITDSMTAYVPSSDTSSGTMISDDENRTMVDQPATLREVPGESDSNRPGGTIPLEDPNATWTGASPTLEDPYMGADTPMTMAIGDQTLQSDRDQDFQFTAFDRVASKNEGHGFTMPDHANEDIGSADTMDSDAAILANDSGSFESPGLNSPSGAGRTAKPGVTGATGSDGRLKKVWEAAIGTSSSRDHGESLRFERAQASDSVFRRVARRKIVDMNAPDAASADYQIKEKIGDGGMGIVFSAVQNAVNRIVAVKSIKSDKQGNESTRKQFFYEAEITADLDHPNIPPIYEMGTTGDEILFYSMKLIQGTPWQKVIAQKTREENLEIFSRIADAVAFAHSRDIIHRDLKPDNVMLGAYGEVYLMDWGLGVNVAKTRSIDFGGTPDFMAPEMAANKRREIGKPSDVYLLGAILFQMIVGKAPHTGKTAMLRLQAAARNEIIETTVEDPLLEIAHKAMATQPNERYASVEEMQDAIREVRQHAASIEISNRSKDLAETAVKNKDYDSFNRSLYGFEEAIGLWRDNQAAQLGLAQTRLAKGQCAYERGDYDLAVETLDRSVHEEAIVYEQAIQAKQLVLQRGQRLKALKRAFMISVTSLSVLLAGVAIYAWIQKLNAEIAKENAEIAKESETVAKNKAIDSARAEAAAKKEESLARERAEKATIAEGNARKKETEAKEEAIASAKAEAIANQAATLARKAAELRTAQVQIGEAQSKTVLAKLQLERFDVQGGANLVNEIRSNASSSIFGDKSPNWNAWPLQRVSLLGNMDLPRQPMQGPVSALDYSLQANRGVASTRNGHLHLFEMGDGKMNITRSLHLDGEIHSVCISPNGMEAIVGTIQNNKSQLLVWQLQSDASPVAIELLGSRMFQNVQYSPDGKRLIAGVNGGLWSWNCEPEWYSKLKAENIRIVQEAKGQLVRLQWISPNVVLASTRQGDRMTLHLVDLITNQARIVPLPSSLESQLSLVTYIALNKRLLLGAKDGRLFVYDFASAPTDASEAKPSSPLLLELPKKHRTRVTQILVGHGNECITMSESEPVAHVWRIETNGDLRYDTHVSGAPNSTGSSNLTTAVAVSNRQWIAVDESGTALTWDIQRQKQRRMLTRQNPEGNELIPAPVLQVFHRENTDTAVSINEDGVVDLWSLQTGQTKTIAGSRWSYFGHTPGAEYVDSAIDQNTGVLVTSASLRNAQRTYLLDPKATQEFCVWNTHTGEMLHRWAESSPEVIEPRVSLMPGGHEILISSDIETRIVGLDGSTRFQNKDIGTRFAIPNPKNPALIAMVKLSGFTWLWNREQPWQVPEIVYYREDRDGNPIKAVWSQDGTRLFQIYSNGRLAIFDLKDNALVATASKLESQKQWRANFGKNFVVSRHFDLDLTVSSVDAQTDQLNINVRIPSAKPISRQTSVHIRRGEWEVLHETTGQESNFVWTSEYPAETAFDSRVHPYLELNPLSRDSVVSRSIFGKQVFVSTRRGNVLQMERDSTEFISFGRQSLVSATSDRSATSLWTLHKDGAIWKLDLSDDDQARWSRLAVQMRGDQIAASPDGSRLAILDRNLGALKIIDSKSGNLIREVAAVAAMVWSPNRDLQLFIAFQNGQIELPSEHGEKVIANTLFRKDALIKSLHCFQEKWLAPNAIPLQYVLVQCEDEDQGWLQFVPLQEEGDPMEQPLRKGALVAVSPTDSVLVTGEGSGTVTVWTAFPYWQKTGAVLDLDGHLGSEMKTMVFSHDGKTLVTADSNQRLLGWISEDKTISGQ
jgi:serine/threonine protein kinase/WD40 repeat protein